MFNVINETYEEQGFAVKMAELVEAGRWCELERSPAFQSYLLRVSERNSRIFVFRVAG